MLSKPLLTPSLVLFLLAILHYPRFSKGAPAPEPSPFPALEGLSSASDSSEDVVYDQRQNGSENLRIHMNDVTLVVAPSDGILQLMGASAADFLVGNELQSPNKNTNANINGNNINGIPNGSNSNNGNKITSTVYTSDCGTDSVAKCKHQPYKKNRLRLSSILVPLLNRAAGN